MSRRNGLKRVRHCKRRPRHCTSPRIVAHSVHGAIRRAVTALTQIESPAAKSIIPFLYPLCKLKLDTNLFHSLVLTALMRFPNPFAQIRGRLHEENKPGLIRIGLIFQPFT